MDAGLLTAEVHSFHSHFYIAKELRSASETLVCEAVERTHLSKVREKGLHPIGAVLLTWSEPDPWDTYAGQNCWRVDVTSPAMEV